MTIKSQEISQESKGHLTIICREVLDILDSTEESSATKCLDIRDLINSYVSANSLDIKSVQTQGGLYIIEIKD